MFLIKIFKRVLANFTYDFESKLTIRDLFWQIERKNKMFIFLLWAFILQANKKEMFDQDKCALQQIDQDSFSYLWTNLDFFTGTLRNSSRAMEE